MDVVVAWHPDRQSRAEGAAPGAPLVEGRLERRLVDLDAVGYVGCGRRRASPCLGRLVGVRSCVAAVVTAGGGEQHEGHRGRHRAARLMTSPWRPGQGRVALGARPGGDRTRRRACCDCVQPGQRRHRVTSPGGHQHQPADRHLPPVRSVQTCSSWTSRTPSPPARHHARGSIVAVSIRPDPFWTDELILPVDEAQCPGGPVARVAARAACHRADPSRRLRLPAAGRASRLSVLARSPAWRRWASAGGRSRRWRRRRARRRTGCRWVPSGCR